VGFEPTISAGERPKTYASDRAVTGTGIMILCTLTKSRNPEQKLNAPRNPTLCRQQFLSNVLISPASHGQFINTRLLE